MKQLRFSTIIILSLFFACTNPKGDNIRTQNIINDKTKNNIGTTINIKKSKDIPDNAFQGDFDGDNDLEWAWLIPPKIKAGEMECLNKCSCTITFSNPVIPDLIISDYCIGGFPQNEGDLNNDGQDEISIIPHWFTSSWRSAKTYRLTENGWQNLIRPIQIWLNGDSTLDYVQKDLENTGHVIITEYRWTNEMTDVIVVSESVKLD